MANRDLIQAFDDCIDRINDGATLSECLRLYPQYADELRSLLETGRLVKQAQADDFEARAAQQRVRFRVEAALQSPHRPATRTPRVLGLVATLLVVLFAGLLSVGIAAQDTLPGDALYGVKRARENIWAGVSPEGELLREQYNQRRLDEIQALLDLQRAESVTFQGEVTDVDGSQWVVAGFTVDVTPEIAATSTVRPGAVVVIDGFTTQSGSIIAREVEVIRQVDAIEQRESPPQQSEPTLTPITTNTPPLTPTATPNATAVPQSTNTACAVQAPDGWLSYTVRPGDTLSSIAVTGGVSVDELMSVNCLTNTTIIVSQTLLVPVIPPTQPPIVVTTAPQSSEPNVPPQPSNAIETNSSSSSSGSSDENNENNNNEAENNSSDESSSSGGTDDDSEELEEEEDSSDDEDDGDGDESENEDD